MPVLNADIPIFKCLIKRSYYTHNKKHDAIFDEAVAFAIQSVAGKILTFHVMFDFGMLRSRVPLSSIYLKPPQKNIEPDMKTLWDCFSENVSVNCFSYLSDKRCEIVLKDKRKVWGTYMFTVDWFDNPYSDEPSFYKSLHVIAADDGFLLGQPNNRIFFRDMNWVTKDFPVPLSGIKTDDELISVEDKSDRWVSEDGNNYYYDIKTQKNAGNKK